ncbi:MAG: hypothetical protein B7Z66_14950 [Chromatiales bacterium 21-64-14]|nr:MAG: hypothetical protein B7Z66_14950 [Chromatiales bacterium 21-64-14]
MEPTTVLDFGGVSNVVARIGAFEPSAALLDALSARYPGYAFSLVAVRDHWYCDGPSIGTITTRLTRDTACSRGQRHPAHGHSPAAVWAEKPPAKPIAPHWAGRTYYIAAPVGDGPADYYQIEIDQNWVQGPAEPIDEAAALYTPGYELRAIMPIAAFVRAMAAAMGANAPGAPMGTVTDSPAANRGPARTVSWPLAPRELHWLRDWQASSAGREAMAKHWFLELFDLEEAAGAGRTLGFIPQCAGADEGMSLPAVIATDQVPILELAAQLEHFDQRAGYPFAWYFYALRGIHLPTGVLGRMAEAIRAGAVIVPEHDAAVLLRWLDQPYDFS